MLNQRKQEIKELSQQLKGKDQVIEAMTQTVVEKGQEN